MRPSLVVLLALSLAACSEKKREPEAAPMPAPPPATSGDAGVQRAPLVGDPSAMHLDDDGDGRVITAPRQPDRAGRPIDVTLRSSPPGAQVAVDGTVIGNTPAFWNGLADGREHQFVFTLRGHAIARYRFVPVSSGVIHAQLDPITEDADAGVPPPEVVPPAPPAPSAMTPPAPPPTVVKPIESPPAPPPATPTAPVGPQP